MVKSCISILGMLMVGNVAFAQDSTELLKKEFEDPPQSAQPRTFWHWTNGNINHEGIAKDQLNSFSTYSEYKKNRRQEGWYFDDEAGELHVRLSGSSAEDITVAISK